jgi:hypothetical protein
MKQNEAICSAIACAASSMPPIRPIRSAAALNTVTSKAMVSPIGTPIRQSARKRGQSARQNRPNTW